MDRHRERGGQTERERVDRHRDIGGGQTQIEGVDRHSEIGVDRHRDIGGGQTEREGVNRHREIGGGQTHREGGGQTHREACVRGRQTKSNNGGGGGGGGGGGEHERRQTEKERQRGRKTDLTIPFITDFSDGIKYTKEDRVNVGMLINIARLIITLSSVAHTNSRLVQVCHYLTQLVRAYLVPGTVPEDCGLAGGDGRGGVGVGVVRQDLVGDVVLNESQCPERQ